MLDLDLIRNNPDRVKQGAAAKGVKVDIDHLLEIDARLRGLMRQCEDLRSQRNAASKEVSRLKQSGQDAAAIIEQVGRVNEQIKQLEPQMSQLEAELRELRLNIPNLPADDVPVGRSAEQNVIVRTWGEKPKLDFKPKPHWDIGTDLGIIDFERATKLTGSNFAMFVGAGAALVRALISYMLDLHTREHGYVEIAPPFIANRATMVATGQLPKFEEDMYRCNLDDYFLIPTAEAPLTSLHRDEVLDAARLPINYTAYTPCWRREAGSYGRDTRGLTRVHQFDKVEMFKIVHPDTSWDELEKLTRHAEDVLQRLGLHYRVVLLCTGEMSFSNAKCYDLELWAPGLERWFEVSSCSNFLDYQARRGNIRFKEKGGKPQFVHTLNGSGVAFPRLIIALLESYQQPDGSVVIPEALRKYMGGMERIERK